MISLQGWWSRGRCNPGPPPRSEGLDHQHRPTATLEKWVLVGGLVVGLLLRSWRDLEHSRLWAK